MAAFDPTLFTPVARSMKSATSLDKEARTRTAIGRAYYALFLRVRSSALTALGRDVDEDIGHGALTNALFSAGARTPDDKLVALGTMLQTLYEARRNADYLLLPPEPWASRIAKPNYADNLVRRAEESLRRLPTLNFSTLKGLL